MSLKNNDFPSSAAFDQIAEALSGEAEKKEAIKKANCIFCFTLKNKSGVTESWFIDLKETGAVGKGEAPAGKSATVTMSMSDDNFGKLVTGKANAQRLFMAGQLKVKGDVMKATKAEVVLKQAQSRAKL
jgi:putative sterol carrier protein